MPIVIGAEHYPPTVMAAQAATQAGSRNNASQADRKRAMTSSSQPPVSDLLTASAVRERARMIFAVGRHGSLPHFTLRLDRLPACAAFIADTIRCNYPTLAVPPHSRWRHLDANGHSWANRLGSHLSTERHKRARQRIDLAVTSVLLDAGAGPAWKWRDPVTGRNFARSEGLALASLEAFRAGLFSSLPHDPCRADAKGLANVSVDRLADVFQVRDDNPLIGLDGRISLLQRVGDAIAQHDRVYGTEQRIGSMFDYVHASGGGDEVAATELLHIVLTTLGGIWPSRIVRDGIALGDTWEHSSIDVEGPTRNLIPFHKLSQWLTYSLIEPFQDGAIRVDGWDKLTGLAEYRNGGLFIDTGVIVPRDPALLATPLTPDREPIIEWRALTVALLDEIAPLVRAGLDLPQMPLASILEGGTWSAGRRIAVEKRPGGDPPLNIVSDGTVF